MFRLSIQQVRMLPVLLVAVFIGCSASNTEVDLGPPVPDEAQNEILRVVQGFWSAAAAQDANTLQTHVGDQEPIEWAQKWLAAHEDFFQTTKDHIELEDAYYARSQTDTVTVQIRVPWVSCPPPVHAGERDRYYLELVRPRGTWLIVDIWKDIC